MVTFPLVSPAGFGVAAVEWGPRDIVARAKNPFTLHDLVQVYDGQMWQGVLTLYALDAATGRALAAWLTSLSVFGAAGPLGTFRLGDPAHVTPAGAAKSTPGTPVVSGAGQTGFALAVEGLPVSTAGYLLAGDYIQLGTGAASRLHMVLEDAGSDGLGEATLSIWPSLRASPVDQDPVVVSGAEGVFAIPAAHRPWRVRAPRVYEPLSLPVQEHIV